MKRQGPGGFRWPKPLRHDSRGSLSSDILPEILPIGWQDWRVPRSLLDLLSPSRVAPYLAATCDDLDAAIALYDWNANISAAFFESIHYLEIGLRNAIDDAVGKQFGTGWLTQESGLLTPNSRKVLSVALRHAGGAEATHGKIVAELPFGFWWSLLADDYNRRLWQPALQHAFEGPVRRRLLHAELDEVRRLRNRIAHHEPIHSRDLNADYRRTIDIAERIGVSLGSHIAGISRVPTLLSTRPATAPLECVDECRSDTIDP